MNNNTFHNVASRYVWALLVIGIRMDHDLAYHNDRSNLKYLNKTTILITISQGFQIGGEKGARKERHGKVYPEYILGYSKLDFNSPPGNFLELDVGGRFIPLLVLNMGRGRETKV